MTDETQSDFPTAWRPEAGDKITGTVLGVTLSPDFGYGPYPIVTLKTESGEQAVHAMHQVLRSELARRRPKNGDELDILYIGKRDSKAGNSSFHAYKVFGGSEPEFNWDSELPVEERQARAAATAAPPIASSPTPSQAAPAGLDPVEDDDVPF